MNYFDKQGYQIKDYIHRYLRFMEIQKYPWYT